MTLCIYDLSAFKAREASAPNTKVTLCPSLKTSVCEKQLGNKNQTVLGCFALDPERVTL